MQSARIFDLMELSEILEILKAESDPTKAKSLERFGVSAKKALGLTTPFLRSTAKSIGIDHDLALKLWKEDYHECKLLAGLIADPSKSDIALMDSWVGDIYSWDVCDQLCVNLLVKTSYRWELPERWASQTEEYVRRAGLVMIVALRIHDRKARDEDFEPLFPLLVACASDDRNFVKKAVNWAIRELGKRSAAHHPKMIELCESLLSMDDGAARWIARDALRELQSDKVLQRVAKL